MAKRTAPSFVAYASPARIPPVRSVVALALAAILGAIYFSGGKVGRAAAADERPQGTLLMMEGAEKGDVKYVEVPSGRSDVTRYAAMKDGKPMAIRAWMVDVAAGLPPGHKAASDLSNIIATSPYASILFETAGASWTTSAEAQFEFAFVDMPALRRFAENSPDRESFAEHFDACNKSEYKTGGKKVCAFANLGGDARLVAPLPQSQVNDSTYSHLAAFVRTAPKEQIAEFWKASASNYLDELTRKHKEDAEAKTWFSTNGMGVAWLHLRLDARPKYYSYAPFRR
ncbi:hypothetical protein ACHAXT_003941 [Thalassiosira profunda]